MIAAPVASVSVDPPASTLGLGATVHLTATLKEFQRQHPRGSASDLGDRQYPDRLGVGIRSGDRRCHWRPDRRDRRERRPERLGQYHRRATKFNAAWHLRRQIAITTGAASIPTGYSVPLQFDHAALVAASTARRVGVRRADRLLVRDGVAGTRSSARCGFVVEHRRDDNLVQDPGTNRREQRRQQLLPLLQRRCATSAANSANVFLLADDFETANLNKWIGDSPGLWQIDNTRSHSGTFALMYPTEGGRSGRTSLPIRSSTWPTSTSTPGGTSML